MLSLGGPKRKKEKKLLSYEELCEHMKSTEWIKTYSWSVKNKKGAQKHWQNIYHTSPKPSHNAPNPSPAKPFSYIILLLPRHNKNISFWVCFYCSFSAKLLCWDKHNISTKIKLTFLDPGTSPICLPRLALPCQESIIAGYRARAKQRIFHNSAKDIVTWKSTVLVAWWTTA